MSYQNYVYLRVIASADGGFEKGVCWGSGERNSPVGFRRKASIGGLGEKPSEADDPQIILQSKNKTPNFFPSFPQMLTNFQNSFTGTMSDKFVMKQLIIT